MRIEVTPATTEDIATLEELYRGLENEMRALHPMWPRADGLDEPISVSFARALEEPDTVVLLGRLDDVAFGFILARVEALRAQAGEERVGSIRLIYVDHPAREVAIGEEMREAVLTMLRARGITKFDAHVLPGHRLAKNFFESGGFSARSIIMHHDDDR